MSCVFGTFRFFELEKVAINDASPLETTHGNGIAKYKQNVLIPLRKWSERTA